MTDRWILLIYLFIGVKNSCFSYVLFRRLQLGSTPIFSKIEIFLDKVLQKSDGEKYFFIVKF